MDNGNEDGNIFETGDQLSVESPSRKWFSPSGSGNPSFKENSLMPRKRKMIFCGIKEKKTMLQFKHKEEGKYTYKVSLKNKTKQLLSSKVCGVRANHCFPEIPAKLLSRN